MAEGSRACFQVCIPGSIRNAACAWRCGSSRIRGQTLSLPPELGFQRGRSLQVRQSRPCAPVRVEEGLATYSIASTFLIRSGLKPPRNPSHMHVCRASASSHLPGGCLVQWWRYPLVPPNRISSRSAELPVPPHPRKEDFAQEKLQEGLELPGTAEMVGVFPLFLPPG